jgi:tRNA(fMet)-specific endonuclease VapC
MLIVDTDVLIEIFDKRSERGKEAFRLIQQSGENIAITSINLHEILYGLHKYGKRVDEVNQLPVLSYTKADANLSAKMELNVERKGTPIRRTDAIIAAIAINNSASLYTFDSHFQPFRTMGLQLFE